MTILREAFSKALIALFFVCVIGTAYAGGRRDRYGYGPGMMGGGYGPGMMGNGYGYGPGMMGPFGDDPQSNAPQGLGVDRITIEDAKAVVLKYLDASGNKNLAIDEIMEFDRNFYALVKEKDTGIGAFELLVDPYRGYVGPEPGPNMMWNAKYGHMSWGIGVSEKMPIDVPRAREYAQKYLDGIGPGFSVEEKPDVFYGYYTAHILKDDKVVGMLSVNGYSGQVWFHSWHGTFRVMEKED